SLISLIDLVSFVGLISLVGLIGLASLVGLVGLVGLGLRSLIDLVCFVGLDLSLISIVLGSIIGRNLGLGLHRLVHQLDDGHRGVVALPRTDLGDPQIAALALGHDRRDLGEQLVHHTLVADGGHHLAPGVQVTPLRLGDQP